MHLLRAPVRPSVAIWVAQGDAVMNRRIFLGLAAALAVGACSTRNVSSDTTPGANLAGYKSFTVISSAPVPGSNPVAYERVRQGVAAALTSKGFTQSDPADLSVMITLGKRDRTDVTTSGWWGQWADVYQYTEGKMSVDVFNTSTRQPLWHGQATQTIDPNGADPATIDAAVADVMARFPARS
jgi:hypothetical protein